MPISRCIIVLRSRATSPGLASVCALALSEAIQQGLDVPNETARVLWDTVERSPDAAWSSTATAAIGLSATAAVAALAIEAALERHGGLDRADAALDVLSGSSAARYVTDEALLALAERAQGLRLVYRCANVIRSVCELRRVPAEVVMTIAEGWSRRPDKPSRISALDRIRCTRRRPSVAEREGACSAA